ncbi:MAG: hypothetical protein HC794_03160 [Nitrospiraceae bacterium]|nr:hypothetical protein [Nitrospiraceae bacterium]
MQLPPSLRQAIDQAVADGVDVINYSIGSDTPGLNGIDDIAFLFADDAGVFVKGFFRRNASFGMFCQVFFV